MYITIAKPFTSTQMDLNARQVEDIVHQATCLAKELLLAAVQNTAMSGAAAGYVAELHEALTSYGVIDEVEDTL
jgi:hypothetical protein